MSQSVDDAIASLFPEDTMLPQAPPTGDEKSQDFPMGWEETEDNLCAIATVPAMTLESPLHNDQALVTPKAHDQGLGVWVSCEYSPLVSGAAQASAPAPVSASECYPLAYRSAPTPALSPSSASIPCPQPAHGSTSTDNTQAGPAEHISSGVSSDEDSWRSSPAEHSLSPHGISSASASQSQPQRTRKKHGKRKEKVRLRAWTDDEHERFVYALDKFRTEKTEAVGPNGERSVGLGPGIAEVIATMVGTRNAAQVRSHAQKYFKKQRKETGQA